MTNGVHLPDEDRIDMLKDLIFQGEDETYAIYATDEGKIKDIVKVPLDIIGKYSKSFTVIMEHMNTENGYSMQRAMYCFSAIYND